MKKSKYISLVGSIVEPENAPELAEKFPATEYSRCLGYGSDGEPWYRYYDAGFRKGLEYGQSIISTDCLDIYLAIINENTGHLVLEGPGDWVESCFCLLEGGKPVKSEDNYNPNPIPQIEF